MKRFHNKRLELPSSVVTGTLQSLRQGHVHCWLYTVNDLSPYSDLYCTKIEQIDLPMMDVYEVRALSTKGIVVAYLFDSHAKAISSAFNYVCAYTPQYSDMTINEVKETDSRLQLRYKIKDIFLYSMGIYGSMVTVGFNQKIKDRLEF